MPSSVLFTKVLVANRGEIALRTVRALHDLGIASVAVYADDDAASPHVQAASAAVALGATGPAAYLDGARLIAIAQAQPLGDFDTWRSALPITLLQAHKP